ncbi:MAG TPA: c-type cytochrome [Bryobacteraceae bacterium]|nr:c-type cytochrome [Bryobacteraceae bacterium]
MKRFSGVAVCAVLAVSMPAFAQRGGRGAGRGGAAAATGAQRTTGDSVGPYNKQIVDPAAADRGKHVYVQECVDCHGPTARGVDMTGPGTNSGPNLIRSLVVLHDRYGSELGPFLRKGHPLQSKQPASSLTEEQIVDLSHFLKQRVDDALKRSPMGDNINVITGDAAAGKAYFDGAGKCSTCHAVTAGGKNTLFDVSAKYADPVNLQQSMLFPGGGRGGRGGRGAAGAPTPPNPAAVTLTVTPPGGQPVTGEIVLYDDFDVQIRDAKGEVHRWTRTPALKIVKNDPLAAHHEILDTITDKNIHDLVVYLETLK